MDVGGGHRKLGGGKQGRGTGREQARFADHAVILRKCAGAGPELARTRKLSSMAQIGERIGKDIITAMKAKQEPKLTTLRLVKAAFKSKEIDKRQPLTDAEEQAIITTMLKQRRESIEQFTKGGRPELADREQVEIVLIDAYMPQAASDEDVAALVAGAIEHVRKDGNGEPLGAKDMGAVMKVAQARALADGQRIDGKTLSQAVKAELSKG